MNRQDLPAGRKPRKSCDQCTNLKIGCTKEKPQCSKCVRRKTSCTYSMTRRPGRPGRNSKLSESTKPSATHEKTLTPERRLAIHSREGSSELVDSDFSSELVSNPSSANLSHNMLNMEPSRPTAAWHELGNDFLDDVGFDGVLNLQESTMNYTELPPLNPISNIQDNYTGGTITSAASSSFTDLLDPFGVSGQPFGSHLTSTTAGDVSGIDVTRTGPAEIFSAVDQAEFHDFLGCQCVSLAVVLMDKPSTTVHSMGLRTTQSLTLKTVNAGITELQSCIKEVISILDCKCAARDGNLCVLLALILFRILDDYKSLATLFESNSENRTPTPPSANSPVFPSFDKAPRTCSLRPDRDEHLERVALQMVLSNLLSVQRVMKRLGGLFEAVATHNLEPLEKNPPVLEHNGANTSPGRIPTAVFKVVESEMQKTHKTLTAATLVRLREMMELSLEEENRPDRKFTT